MNESSRWYSLEWEARAEPGGEIVSPVSLETVQGWLEHRHLGSRAELRKLGGTEWLRAQTVLASTTGVPSARELLPVESARAPAPRSRRPLLLGVIGLVIVVAIVTVVVAYRLRYFERWRGARPLPVAAARLPNRTAFISENRLEPDLEEFVDLPAEYAASSLADLACGGVDVIELLRTARGKDLAWQQQRGLLDLLQNDIWRQALACGEAVRKSMPEPKLAFVSFVDGDKRFGVTLLRAGPEQLTGKWTRHSFSGFPGQCESAKDVTSVCAADGGATFYDAPLRAVGSLDAVENFARSYASKHEELSTNVEILDELIALTDHSDAVALAAKPEHVDFSDVCKLAAPVVDEQAFLKACFPEGQERVVAAIETKVRGLAMERNFLTRDGFHWKKILLARDEDAATSIEKDVSDLVRDWKSHLENNESQLVKIYRQPSTFIRDNLMRAALDPFLRGLHGMKVERDGRVVRLVVDEPFRPEESKTLREFTESRRADQIAAIKIVAALLQKSIPPEESLAVFVGPEAAAWIVTSRATEEDCTALAAKLRAVSGGDVAPELFGLKFRLEKQLAGASCVGRAMPSAVKSCFLSAASLAEFAKCKLPDSPFVLAAEQKLQGQWRVSVPENLTSAGAALLRTCRLRISQTTTTFGCGTEHWPTSLLVESSSPGSGSLAFPVDGGVTSRQFTFEGDDSFELKHFTERADLKFERVKDEPSLEASKPPAEGGT